MLARRNVPARAPAALVLAALLAASGCAGRDDDASAGRTERSPSATTPHGYVAGAQEAAEEQSRLLLADPETGDTRVLDLITGETHDLAPTPGASGLSADGRFAFLAAADGTRVIDTGAWTVDHGDHVHYYRAAVRDVGRIPGGPGARVRSDTAVTAVTDAAGRAAVLDRTAMETGRPGTARALPGTYSAPVVPYEEHFVALAGEDDRAEAVVLDRDGRRVAAPGVVCESPRGDAVTRRGVVFGCADGALLVSAADGRFTAERIPYGDAVPAAERATAFHHRAGSDTLTAPAGERAVWVLDVTDRSWTRVETGPVLAANTAGEGAPLMVLAADGSLHGYDIATGQRTARTKTLLSGRAAGHTAAPLIEVDRSRAYVNDPVGKRVFEIDYNDGLRIARTFDLDITPALMKETGR
ncbi:hypothetical protein [Streptomyces genisteinicus]|uniref:Lipoprotein n=1 Tax=Streptomyces genisteinicus TaxID=2768068 RepID=A0A7H0I187_9ACTN|nr:hypothetical protein [Streptomyces genisteinicus]QNP66553.1 hypothetical protein IAG43_28925 [Streptomyces genisteinicus]